MRKESIKSPTRRYHLQQFFDHPKFARCIIDNTKVCVFPKGGGSRPYSNSPNVEAVEVMPCMVFIGIAAVMAIMVEVLPYQVKRR